MKFLWAFLSHSAAAMFGFCLSAIFARDPDNDESHSKTGEREQEEILNSLADEVMDEVELETAMSEEDAAVCERNFA